MLENGWRKGNLLTLLVRMQASTATRTGRRFLKKLKIEWPFNLSVPLLGIHTEEIRVERDTCTPVFVVALFYNSQDMEAT